MNKENETNNKYAISEPDHINKVEDIKIKILDIEPDKQNSIYQKTDSSKNEIMEEVRK